MTRLASLMLVAVVLGGWGCAARQSSVEAESIAAACGLVDGRPSLTSMACFARLDQDGNGALSRPEAARLRTLGARFDVFDEDGDDQLSPGEVQSYLGASDAARAGGLGY